MFTTSQIFVYTPSFQFLEIALMLYQCKKRPEHPESEFNFLHSFRYFTKNHSSRYLIG